MMPTAPLTLLAPVTPEQARAIRPIPEAQVRYLMVLDARTNGEIPECAPVGGEIVLVMRP